MWVVFSHLYAKKKEGSQIALDGKRQCFNELCYETLWTLKNDLIWKDMFN
jgi:hypothetical protein